MCEYKAGDKVRVVNVGTINGVSLSTGELVKGAIHTVASISSGNSVRLSDAMYSLGYFAARFELVSTLPTYPELKPFMRVVTASGQAGMVADHAGRQIIAYERDGGFCSFDYATFDPTAAQFNSNIVEVYAAAVGSHIATVGKRGALLWKATDAADKLAAIAEADATVASTQAALDAAKAARAALK